MPTTGWTEQCPKCGAETLEVEKRYHESRAECSECGYFYERGSGTREGLIRKRPEERGQYLMVNYWFSLPSTVRGGHVEYLRKSDMKCSAKLQVEGPHLAAKQGDCAKLSEALATDPGLIESREKRFELTLLHAAALGGWVEAAELLLTRGADLHTHDRDGATALHLAIDCEYGAMVELLVGRGADVNSPDADGDTPLHYACRLGLSGFAEYLLEHGAESTTRNCRGESPLSLAMWSRREGDDLVDLLLTREGVRLHLAAKDGDAGQVQAILTAEMGEANRPDSAGHRPLHWALGNVRSPGSTQPDVLEIIRLLLTHGADAEARFPNGAPVLSRAVENPEVVRLLIAHCADVRAADSTGDTALHAAAAVSVPRDEEGTDQASHVIGAIGGLLAAGADVNAANHDGLTPLHVAVSRGQAAVAGFLVSAGANVGAADAEGRIPLHLAAYKDERDVLFSVDKRGVLDMLLEHTMDPNARDKQGLTPLHYAARHGSEVE